MSDPIPTDRSGSARGRFARLLRPASVVILLLGGAVAVSLVLTVVLGGGSGAAETKEPPQLSNGSRQAPSTVVSETGGRKPPGSPERPSGTQKPIVRPKVRESALLDELRATFGEEALGVKIRTGSGDFVRIDVDTTYDFGPQAATIALDMAKAAAESKVLLGTYPNVTVSAYVWPKNGNSYMTRATAVWVNGARAEPMSTYTDAALQ